MTLDEVSAHILSTMFPRSEQAHAKHTFYVDEGCTTGMAGGHKVASGQDYYMRLDSETYHRLLAMGGANGG